MRNDADLALRIPHEMMEQLQKEAACIFSNVSTVVRIALGEFLQRKNRPVPTDPPSRAVLRERSGARAAERRGKRTPVPG